MTDSGRHSMDVSIVIVNWNSSEFLCKCIRSIFANTNGIEYEVVVIDNASYDGSASIIADQFPSVKFIQSPRNLGFAAANNAASRDCSGRNLLFLNPDTEILGNVVTALSKCLDDENRAGIAAPKLLNTDRTVQTSCIQAFPTITNQLFDSDYLRKVWPNSMLWGTTALSLDAQHPPIDVQAVSGASLMIRRSDFERVGGYTTDYFMYSEDIDLCFKVAGVGYRVLYLPGVSVVHHGGKSSSSSSQSNFSAVMLRESTRKFFHLRRGIRYALLYRFLMGFVALGRMLLLLAQRVLVSSEERECIAKSVSKWKSVLKWAVGQERWVDYASNR